MMLHDKCVLCVLYFEYVVTLFKILNNMTSNTSLNTTTTKS